MDNSNYEVQQSSGKGVACLILGICSIVFSCGGIVGIVCAIISMVLSKQMAAVAELTGPAKVGKILGIIGLVMSILGLLFWVLWFILMGVAIASEMM